MFMTKSAYGYSYIKGYLESRKSRDYKSVEFGKHADTLDIFLFIVSVACGGLYIIDQVYPFLNFVN